MQVQLINKKENKILCTADVTFGLDVLIVNTCEGMDTEELQFFLEQRAEIPNYSYDMDDIILKKLDLYYKKNCFGRMTYACVLYAMLCNFEKKDDDFALYPVNNEFVCMAVYDPDFSNLYIWRAYEKGDLQCN